MTTTGRLAAGSAAIVFLLATYSRADLNLRNDGIQFPDGSVQITAAAPAGDPVQFSGVCSIADDEYFSEVVTLYTVPSGQRLEIESVSLTALDLAPAETVLPLIATTVGGGLAFLAFEELVGGTVYPAGPRTVRASRPNAVRLYADPGTDVLCQVDSTTNVGTNRRVQTIISGRLVSVSP